MRSVVDDSFATSGTAILRIRLTEPSLEASFTKAVPTADPHWDIEHILADCAEQILDNVVLVEVFDIQLFRRITLYLLYFSLFRWHHFFRNLISYKISEIL